MKKLTSVILTALLISTLAACSSRNSNTKNQDRNSNQGNTVNQGGLSNSQSTNNQGTTQGTRTDYNTGTTTGSYRDGVYSGVAYKSPSGTQTATVVVRGGRITNIVLGTIDDRGNQIVPKDMGIISGPGSSNIGAASGGTGTGMTYEGGSQGSGYGGGSGTGNGSGSGMRYNSNNAGTGSNGNTTSYGSTASNGSPASSGNATSSGSTTSYGSGSNMSYSGSANTGTPVDTVSGTVPVSTPDYESLRRQVSSAMISAQTFDINISHTNSAIALNWKHAVKRALDKARY